MRALRVVWAPLAVLGFAVFAYRTRVFARFEPPPKVSEQVALAVACSSFVERLPRGPTFRFGVGAGEAEAGSDDGSAAKTAPPRLEEREPDYPGIPQSARDRMLHPPYGAEISYLEHWFECRAANRRLVRLDDPLNGWFVHDGQLFRASESPDHEVIAISAFYRDVVSVCVEWHPLPSGCSVDLKPIVFFAGRKAPANLFGLAHGYTVSVLPFSAYAPEHLMDALCAEVARLGDTDPSRCVKTIERNDMQFDQWAP